jgi:hypothetical protein
MKPHEKVVMPFVAYLPGQSSSVHDDAVSLRSLLFGILIRVQVRGCTFVLEDELRRVEVALYNRRILYSAKGRSSKNNHDDRVSSQEPASGEGQRGMV